MEFRGRLLFMMILIIVAPVVIAGAVSYRLSAALHNEHVQVALEQNVEFQKNRFQQNFSELKTLLTILSKALDGNEDRNALRTYLVEVQKQFDLRDALVIDSKGVVLETATSPEAVGESVYGELFVNTRLPDIMKKGVYTLTDFDPTGQNKTGFMVVPPRDEGLTFVAEFGRETFHAMLSEMPGASVFHPSIQDARGRFRFGPSIAREMQRTPTMVRSASDTVNLDGVAWILIDTVDPSIDAPLKLLQRSILILCAGVGFVALLLAWTMLRSISMLSAPVESRHMRGQRIHEIAIASSALDERGKSRALDYIRKLIRESPGQYPLASDDPVPIEEKEK